MLSKIIIVALCLGVVSAAVWRGKNPKKPAGFEDKEGCYIQEINDVVPFGTTINPIGFCYRIYCAPMMDYASCGVVGTSDDNCHVTQEDLTKPYPDCCPDIKCDDDNKID